MVKRCHFLKCYCFGVLVLAVLGYFYILEIKKSPLLNPKQRIQGHATKIFIPFRGQDGVSPNTALSAASNTSNVLSQPDRTTTLKPRTPQQSTITAVVIQPGLQTPTAPGVSYEKYLVEYPHKYHFLINEPQKCEQEKPFVVLIVPVAPHNRPDRDTIRSTWGSERLVHGKEVRLFFLLGSSNVKAEPLQQQLLQESKEHRDLIQSSFIDCYNNLTIKTMVMMEWLKSFCSGASYAMKIDSDMFLNVPNLVYMLLEAPRTNYMTGLVVYGSAVLRDPSSKWYLPVDLYPEERYPPYALGLGYVLSLDLPERFIGASRHVKALYIEDVYLGLCMQYLGILPSNPPSGTHFNVFPVAYSRCAFSNIVATTLLSNMNLMWLWKDFTRPGPHCLFKPDDA